MQLYHPYRLTVEWWSLTNIVQLLQPLLGGFLRRSRWCPLKRGFIVLNWKIFGYFSLHFRWVIHRPVKIAIGNGSEKSYIYFLTPSFCSFKRRISRSPPINVARVRILASTPYVGWVCCWFYFKKKTTLYSRTNQISSSSQVFFCKNRKICG